MSERLTWIHQELDSLKEAGLYNRIRTLGSPQGAWLMVDGKRVLNFCSNNYLGLANEPVLVKTAQEYTQKFGVGPAAVRSIAGTMDIHLELERRLAAFKGVEAAITFQSGFTANLATLPALAVAEKVQPPALIMVGQVVQLHPLLARPGTVLQTAPTAQETKEFATA